METALQGCALRGWDHRLRGLLLAALLSFGIQGSTAQVTITLDPASPVVGGQVNLIVNRTTSSTDKTLNATWYRGDTANPGNVILLYSPGTPNIGEKYTALAGGSLQISNLTTSDNGNYTCIVRTTANVYSGTAQLMVSDPSIGVPTINPGPASTTTAMLLHPGTGISGNSPTQNTSLTWIIIGAVFGVVTVVATVTTATILLYKRCHKLSGPGGGTEPIPPPQNDLPSSTIHDESYENIIPGESNSPTHSYVIVIPDFPKDHLSSPMEAEHMYEDVQFKYENIYNYLER